MEFLDGGRFEEEEVALIMNICFPAHFTWFIQCVLGLESGT